jgi:hypothetical protein
MNVQVWWGFLVAVSMANLSAWFVLGMRLRRQPEAFAARRWIWRLAGVFAFGCAFRSVLPRADVQRICLVDTWLSSVAVGRSVATVAELAYMAIWALLVAELARGVGAPWVARAARLVVPAIAFAETCSWYAILTTNYLGNVVEESTWTATGLLLTTCAIALARKVGPRARRCLVPAIALGIGYVAFMTTVDVPMYLHRWQADTAAGRAYLSLGQGLVDVATRWRVTWEPYEWWSEMPWMALYFSVAVWSALAAVLVPRLESETLAPEAATA